jgi:acyl-CoA thioester hydrolase
MLISETQIRVRYGETDKMGYVYYGNYPLYYEVGRTEMIRKMGWSYRKMEEEGIMLPVLSLNSKYIKPAFYDDVLTVKTTMKKIPEVRIHFEYEVFNEKGETINVGDTTLVFVNAKTMKPMEAPPDFLEDLKKYFAELK